jgi:hypothetical protein
MPFVRSASRAEFNPAEQRRQNVCCVALAPAQLTANGFVDHFEDLGDVQVLNWGNAPTTARQGTRSIQEGLDRALTRPEPAKTHALRAAAITNGRLAHDGIVLSSTGEIVRESLFDAEHERRIIAKNATLAPASRLSGTYASLITLWCENYFHWMMDALPRIALVERSGIKVDGYIVPDGLTRFQRESLTRLGIPAERLRPFVNEHVVVDRLVWASAPAAIGHPDETNISFLRERLGGTHSAIANGFLYLRRRGTRRARNEKEIERVLITRGFRALDPGELSLDEQIEAFSGASLLVGCHGAAFTNAVFARHRLAALELYNPHHVNSSMVNLDGCALARLSTTSELSRHRG